MTKTPDLLINNSILYRATQKYYDKRLEKFNIGYGQILFLMMIYENEGITMKELSRLGSFDKGTTTKGINKLESIGYVRLEENPHDKRSKLIYTTPKAEEILSMMYIIRKDWLQQLMKGIDGEGEKLFNEYLDKIVHNASNEMNDVDVRFYGMQKLTLLDYPGKMAATLFTGGCNFRCPFCHNKDLVFLPESLSEIQSEDIFSYLEKRKSILEGVVISGGEPLLHKGLEVYLRRIKEMGYVVKLDTNGTFPERMIALIEEGLIDYVAVDIKNTSGKYAKTIGLDQYRLDAIEKTVNYLLEDHVDYEFRTTVVEEFHDVEDIEEIAKTIKGAKAYYLQNFRDADSVIEEGMHSVSHDTLLKMKEAAEKYLDHVEIRGE